jgi:hypothetical protein
MVHDALLADDPVPALVAILTHRSILERGDLSSRMLDLLAVALAGGEERDRSFAETAHLAGEREGWSWGQILNLPAWIVDRAARSSDGDEGWSTIVFAEEEPADLNALTREIAQTLLNRSVEVERSESPLNDPCPGPGPRRVRARPLPKPLNRPDTVGNGDPPVIRRPRFAGDDTLFTRAGALLGQTGDDRQDAARAGSLMPEMASTPPFVRRVDAEPSFVRPSTRRQGGSASNLSTRTASVSDVVDAASGTTPTRSIPLATRAPGGWSADALQVSPAAAPPPVEWSHSAARRDALPSQTSVQIERGGDWMNELARALSAECDVRGLDR